jgi:peptide/nickel transport system permease protein
LLHYILNRILLLIPIILAVSFIVYALMDLAPGSVIDQMITDEMTQEDIKELEHLYDLDKPMIYRYGKYMLHLVQGDLGVADFTKISVWDTYITRLPNTLILALAAFIFGSLFAIPLGIFAARHSGTLLDNGTTLFTMLGISIPNFWLGLQLLLVFALYLGWLPAGGNESGFRSLILPAVCSGIGLMANGTRQTRSSMLDVLKADYLRTARAKGVPERIIIRKHALGNAWIPILTTFGGALCHAIAGSAVVESVFAWQGVGLLLVNSVRQRDVTMTLGCVIMTSILYSILMLLVDLMYAFVDPRVKSRFSNSNRKRERTT